MRNGTQEELDLAKEDATLLPFDAKFKIAEICNTAYEDRGKDVYRGQIYGTGGGEYDCKSEVAFVLEDQSDYWYLSSDDLEVIYD